MLFFTLLSLCSGKLLAIMICVIMLEMRCAEESRTYFSYFQYFRNLAYIKLYNSYKEEVDILFKHFDHSSGYYSSILFNDLAFMNVQILSSSQFYSLGNEQALFFFHLFLVCRQVVCR